MVQTAAHSISTQYAGFASRACAFAADLVLINFTLLLITAAAGTVLCYLNFDNISSIGEEPTALGRAIVSLIGFITFLATYFGYPIFFWVTIGQTPGKRLLGLRVIRSGGQRHGVATTLLRVIGYWLSALPFFFGFVWILRDAQRQGWHDKIAGTYVIYYCPKRRRSALL